MLFHTVSNVTRSWFPRNTTGYSVTRLISLIKSKLSRASERVRRTNMEKYKLQIYKYHDNVIKYKYRMN